MKPMIMPTAKNKIVKISFNSIGLEGVASNIQVPIRAPIFTEERDGLA